MQGLERSLSRLLSVASQSQEGPYIAVYHSEQCLGQPIKISVLKLRGLTASGLTNGGCRIDKAVLSFGDQASQLKAYASLQAPRGNPTSVKPTEDYRKVAEPLRIPHRCEPVSCTRRRALRAVPKFWNRNEPYKPQPAFCARWWYK